MISLDLSSVETWPSTRELALAYALTMWVALPPLARSWERRSALPSTATTGAPGRLCASAATQATKPVSKASGSILANTSEKVSWEGMPLGRRRKRRNQASLASAKVTTVVQWFAPPMTAHSARVRMSTKLVAPVGGLAARIVEFGEVLGDRFEQGVAHGRDGPRRRR